MSLKKKQKKKKNNGRKEDLSIFDDYENTSEEKIELNGP